jgi:anti-sigma B factor antagonist
VLRVDPDVRVVRRNGRAIVFIRGEMDLSITPQLREALALAQDESSDVIVDLSQVSFMDSSAINALVHGYRRAQDRDRFQLSGAQPNVRRIFEIAGLTELLLPDGPESGSGWREEMPQAPGLWRR